MNKLAIIGSNGAVGQELEKLIRERQFPHSELLTFGSHSIPDFAGIDIAFFCTPSEVSLELAPKARDAGALVIDGSEAFRKRAPLVIPEINGNKLNEHRGVISSPNCTTTMMLMPVAPLHRVSPIQKIVVTTFQAVSGAGKKGIEELKRQVDDATARPTVFPVRCAYNVFLHESPSEEIKMIDESRTVLGVPDLIVCPTCVRVPVVRTHCASLHVVCEEPINGEDAKALLEQAPGVEYREGITPIDAEGKDPVFCGRVRNDTSGALELWIMTDQLRKGAALNMLQIAEVCYETEMVDPPCDELFDFDDLHRHHGSSCGLADHTAGARTL